MTKSTLGYSVGLILFFALGAFFGFGIATYSERFGIEFFSSDDESNAENVSMAGTDQLSGKNLSSESALTVSAQQARLNSEAISRQDTSKPSSSLFDRLIARSEAYFDNRQFELGFELLLQASYETTNIEDQDVFEEVLAKFVDGYQRSLIQTGQLAKLDQVYETLAMQMPNLSSYHLLLGKLRMRMGNAEAALLPLSQITNHPTLGAEARRLISDIENRSELASSTQPDENQEVELTLLSDQYVVTIEINERLKIPVLIDTGAAVTILEPQVLQALGYNLAGPSEYFATANGVVEAPMVWVDSLSIGGSRLQGVAIGGLSLGLNKDVRGLLGMNVLRNFDFKIDQNRRVLILSDR